MEQDLFKCLPSDIINDIFSRLPVRTIAISKCVCRSWLDLLKKDEFVKSHLSRSAAALAVLMPRDNSSWCRLFEFEDDKTNVESSHDHHYNRLTKFDFPHEAWVLGSANGFLFLKQTDFESTNDVFLYVWNPITREYIKLHCPQESSTFLTTYGFGASKITGQHKVVRIVSNCDGHVYTLGTGSWRRIEAPRVLFDSAGYYHLWAFLNGNLHRLVLDSHYNPWISCFDLETECFSTFSISPVHQGLDCMESELCALRDCLCLCDRTFLRDGIVVIWLMKEYGVEKSWTKEYVINLNPDFDRIALEIIIPIKVFKDGDILMDWGCKHFFYYSNKMKTTSEEFGGVFDEFYRYKCTTLLTPSFLSFKSFGMENVISL